MGCSRRQDAPALSGGFELTLTIRNDYSPEDLRLLSSRVGHAPDYSLLHAWSSAAEDSGYGRGERTLALEDGEPVAAAQGILRRRLGLSKLQCGSTSGAGVMWQSGSAEAAVQSIRNLIRRTRPSWTMIFASGPLEIERVAWEQAYTFQLDLRPSFEDVVRRMTPEARRKVKRAQRLGVAVDAGSDEGTLKVAYALITAAAKKRGFSVLPEAYSMALHRHFDREGFQGCVVARIDDRPVSAATYLGNRHTAIWWKGGSSEEGYRTSAGNLVQHAAIGWMMDHGILTYDLGGTHPNRPQYAGIHEFKSSLGGVLSKTVSGSRVSRIGRIALRVRGGIE